MRKLLSEMISDIGEKTCTFTFMQFVVGTLPQVQTNFQKKFSHENLYNNCSKKIFEAFRSVFKIVLKHIANCILRKWIWPM